MGDNMPVGEIIWPTMHKIAGLKLGTANARIKNSERDDVVVMQLSENATIAGVFTQNAFCAEPVKICRHHLDQARAELILINSGNANACTGADGWNAAMACCEALAKLRGCEKENVLPFSTGVIGEVLPYEKICAVLSQAIDDLQEDNWRKAARAIMTTDTVAKGASEVCEYKDKIAHVTGIAKGSGMIKPDMATMLAYIATDAVVEESILEIICKRAADASFNRITIDGDTSTNDAAILIATGENQSFVVDRIDSKAYEVLEQTIIKVFKQLAQLIVRDGEGASKFIEVQVEGGANKYECLDVAYEIAHSPLVKTAAFASDANWGRIVMAIGKAPVEELDSKSVKVWINDVQIVENGGRARSYTEEAGSAEMAKSEFCIRVNLGRGNYSESIWTSDLSHEYIKINAEYRS